MAGTHRIGKKRTADVIAAEIEATCLNITANVAALEKYVKPANLAAKGMGTAGAFFLDEVVTHWMMGCALVIVAGTALASGLVTRPKSS